MSRDDENYREVFPQVRAVIVAKLLVSATPPDFLFKS
jgi:hypothetical protein